jgi:lipopolysaccharide/colanic/teichoic acid biosynthesis glycosyltransferase
MDVVLAGTGLLALSPGLIAVALAVSRGSSGGVLFRQKRLGQDGKLFTIYKFRTMYAEFADLSGVSQTVQGDPRVTPIGAWLRRTSLDELPQLLNVLKGDMSLIGPRPTLRTCALRKWPMTKLCAPPHRCAWPT